MMYIYIFPCWNKIPSDRQDRAAYFWNSKQNTVLWLFNVLWQITVLPEFKQPVNRSSLPPLVIAQNKHEWTSEGRKTPVHTIFQVQVHRHLFNLPSSLFVGQKTADSALWLVRSPVNQTLRRVNCGKKVQFWETNSDLSHKRDVFFFFFYLQLWEINVRIVKQEVAITLFYFLFNKNTKYRKVEEEWYL